MIESDKISVYNGQWMNDLKHGQGSYVQYGTCLIEGIWNLGHLSEMTTFKPLIWRRKVILKKVWLPLSYIPKTYNLIPIRISKEDPKIFQEINFLRNSSIFLKTYYLLLSILKDLLFNLYLEWRLESLILRIIKLI